MRNLRKRQQAINFTLFNIPSLLVYSVFWMLPILLNFVISFSTWNGIQQIPDINWVGIRNYINILDDEVFLKALGNNIYYTVLSIIFIPASALIIALCVEKGLRRTKGFFRVALFAPSTLTLMLVAILFRWVYSIDDGMINTFLGFIGLEALQTDFLGNTDTAMTALFFMGFWKTLPFFMIIMLSGLQGISKDYEEAALIDGCNLFQSIRHVTIPLLKPIITIVIALVVIDGFRVFDLVFVATKGGPANSTAVMATYVYDVALKDFRLGYATALSTVNILIVLVISIIYFRYSMKSNVD